jgi:two-component sensor histidine kinase
MAQLTDPARLIALRDAEILDTDPEPAFDRITALASKLIGAPVALISLVDKDRQFFKSVLGVPAPYENTRETPLSHSFCQHVVSSERMLSVSDARNDPLVKENGAVTDLGVAAYLGVPLKSPEGQVLGSLCVIDVNPRQWTAEDAASLLDLSYIVMDEIALRTEVRARRAAEAQQEFLIAELHHRVKNTLATVQAVVQMSLRAATDLKSFGVSINSRIASLANTHTMLSEQQWAAISFRDLLASELAPYDRAGRVTLDGPDFTMASQTAVTIGMVFHELSTNASKYGALRSPEGSLAIEWTLRREGDDNVIAARWTESGGPSVTPPSREGFGSTLLRRLVERQLHGKVDMLFAPEGLKVQLVAHLPVFRLPKELAKAVSPPGG